jgi:histidinol-phosphate aminotransferase
MVFVDEAYFEFCGKTVRPLVDEFANLIVSRTLSKAWGLAALRVGYCISSPGAIKVMRKIRFPYGVGTLSQILASKALREGKARMLENVSAIMAERERLSGGLRRLGLEVFPGQANFVLVRFPEGISSKEVQGRLAEEASIIVRDRSSLPMLGNCIRITVGTGEENRRLAAELGRILGKSFDGI